jgi:hypothetical protein
MFQGMRKYCQATIGRPARSGRFVSLLVMTGLLCCFTPPSISSPAPGPGPWRWTGVDRIVAIGDIHGAYPAFTELLKASGVVDQSLNWTGGETHLVSLGDLLDRGADSRKVMDLLIRLQQEAVEHGGRVHVVAGNHEIMNLLGDLRYVSAGEFAGFAQDETAAQRERGYREFLAERSGDVALSFLEGGIVAAEGNPRNRREFDELYPRGYFAHRSAFAPDGEYGRWLLSLPALMVINRTVFVHGGLPAITSTADIGELNRRYQADLRRFFALWHQLVGAGVLTHDGILTNRKHIRKALRIADPSSCPREERQDCARERSSATDSQRSPTPEVLTALKELKRLEDSPLFGPSGPLWYRGTVRCKSILEMPVLQAEAGHAGYGDAGIALPRSPGRVAHRGR